MWNELKCIAECSKRISKSLLKKSYVKCRANRSRVKIKKKLIILNVRAELLQLLQVQSLPGV